MDSRSAETSELGLDLIIGHVYRAKRPADCLGLVNDRQIKWIGLLRVQYDSPTVSTGRRYPTVDKNKFLKWAGSDVTDVMPDGEWMKWSDRK